jgi:hypothetical protein
MSDNDVKQVKPRAGALGKNRPRRSDPATALAGLVDSGPTRSTVIAPSAPVQESPGPEPMNPVPVTPADREAPPVAPTTSPTATADDHRILDEQPLEQVVAAEVPVIAPAPAQPPPPRIQPQSVATAAAPSAATIVPRTTRTGAESTAVGSAPIQETARLTREAAAARETVEPDDTFQTSVYLSALARGALRRASKRTGKPLGEIAMDAVDWALDLGILQSLVDRQHIEPRAEGSVFPPRRTRRATRRKGVDNQQSKVLQQVFFTAAQLAAADRLKEEHGAQSRSVLLGTAIEAYLFPPTEKEMQAYRYGHQPPPVDLDAGH